MGSITGSGPLIRETAPEVAWKLVDDGADAVLLTPVWPMCHQPVGLIQSLNREGGHPERVHYAIAGSDRESRAASGSAGGPAALLPAR